MSITEPPLHGGHSLCFFATHCIVYMSKLALALYILIISVLVYEIVLTAGPVSVSADELLPSRYDGRGKRDAPTATSSMNKVGAVKSDVVVSGPTTGPREMNQYKDITYDAASFDLQEAQDRAKRAYENDMAASYETPRGPASAPGGSNAAINSITGGTTVRPIVDSVLQPPPMIAPTPAGPLPVGPSERPDHRCGPAGGGAKCGPDRCCSIYGWCGSPGEPHCMQGTNAPIYNGATTTLPQGISNGGVIKCLTGEIYGIENSQKRLYPTLSIYEKHGSPPFTNVVNCAVLNTVIPGAPYS